MDKIIVKGIVIEGKKRGRRLGFPTANINFSQKIPEGIYISLTTVKDVNYPSLTFVGAAITYGESMVRVETHIFDFNDKIYGEKIVIEILRKIRGNKKFDSEKELVDRMENDKKVAIEYFKKK